MSIKAKTLKELIDDHFDGCQSAFAKAQGMEHRQQVTPMINKGFIAVYDPGNPKDAMLYSPRRIVKLK